MTTQLSTGYPYLMCARRFGIDYGTLLAYADAKRKELLTASDVRHVDRPFDYWEVRAIRTISKFPTVRWIDQDVAKLMRQTLAEKGVRL